MPSEMAIVLNSIGLAPAALMPAFSGTASSRNPKLQGIVSVQTFETPMNGLSMSSALRPIAYRKERAAARSRPWYSARLGRLRGGTVRKLIALGRGLGLADLHLYGLPILEPVLMLLDHLGLQHERAHLRGRCEGQVQGHAAPGR